MEYGPEAIANLARQVTQVFKAALEQQLASSPTAVTIPDVEKEMRELLRQIGAQALGQYLSLGAGTPVAELPCACEGTLHCHDTSRRILFIHTSLRMGRWGSVDASAYLVETIQIRLSGQQKMVGVNSRHSQHKSHVQIGSTCSQICETKCGSAKNQENRNAIDRWSMAFQRLRTLD